MISFSVPGEPIPFARAGANGKRRFTPPKQASYMSIVRMFARRAMGPRGGEPFDGPLALTIRATYLVPASWSAKKKSEARWKESKPDADNIAKLLKDAMNTVVYRDDAQIAELVVQKKYGPIASVVVSVESLPRPKGVM